MSQFTHFTFLRNLRASPLARLFRVGARGTDDIVSVRYSTYTRVKKVDTIATTGDYYYEKNHLGSIVRITSSTGGIIDEYSYTVFGKAYRKNLNGLYKPVAGANDSQIGNTRLYTGREYDKEISLYYMRARYYDEGLGRFVSRDPIGMADSINLYTYTRNSPLNYTDRDGKKAKVLILRGEEFFGGDRSSLITNTTQVEINILLGRGYKKENILIEDIKSINEFNNYINEAYRNKYNGIIYMGHGDSSSITISQTANEVINSDTINQLSVPSDFNIPIRLDSCNTGRGGLFSDSIAEGIAEQLGTTVLAPNGSVAPDVNNNTFIIGDDAYIRGRMNGSNELGLELFTSGPGTWKNFTY